MLQQAITEENYAAPSSDYNGTFFENQEDQEM